MKEKEKVLEALDICSRVQDGKKFCNDCPYYRSISSDCQSCLCSDAAELIRNLISKSDSVPKDVFLELLNEYKKWSYDYITEGYLDGETGLVQRDKYVADIKFRAGVENNRSRVLSLSEINEYLHKQVWVETVDSVTKNSEFQTTLCSMTVTRKTFTCYDLDFSSKLKRDYNHRRLSSGWRCWSEKPTEKQMKETSWSK